MKFRYALQKIVDLKSSEKSMAEWAYAAALGRLRQEEEALQRLLEERARLERQTMDAAQKRMRLAELAISQQYLEVLDMRIRRQKEGVAAAEAQAQSKRNGLVAKSVDEKVWQNAREKSYEQYKMQWLRQQQHELDEIATVRAATARA